MRRPPNLMKSTPAVAVAPTPASAPEPADPGAPANYLDLYGLSKPPFGEALDGAGYILFGSHRRAFGLLTDHISNGIGVVLLHGEEGIGKTATMRATASVAAETGRPTIMISRPNDGRLSLAQLVSALLGHPSTENAEIDRVIEDFLASPRQTLLVDDIDLLPEDCVQLLLSLAQAVPKESASPAMVFSYSADPTGVSARPDLSQLTGLARNTIRLPRLSPAESHQYIERSLWVAGGTTRRLIAPDAMKLLIARAGGVPGIIDRYMEAVFTTGFARGDAMITAKTVAAAMRSIAPRPSERTSLLSAPAERIFEIAAIGLLVIGATAFLYKGLNGPIERPSPVAARPVTPPPPPVLATPPQQTQAATPVVTLPPELIAALTKRGEQSLALGDVAAARLWFQRAAEAGDATAATALGKTYDPNIVTQAGKPDPGLAAAWYHAAIALGDPRAADLMKRLDRP
jgi:type II secretory pathway predicted ATPase ExeA